MRCTFSLDELRDLRLHYAWAMADEPDKDELKMLDKIEKYIRKAKHQSSNRRLKI